MQTKKLISRRNYEKQMYSEAYFLDRFTGDSIISSGAGIIKGILVGVTPEFCKIDIGNKVVRKKKNAVYFSEDECKLALLRNVQYTLSQEYAYPLQRLIEDYLEMEEKYPEKFI